MYTSPLSMTVWSKKVSIQGASFAEGSILAVSVVIPHGKHLMLSNATNAIESGVMGARK